MSQPTVLINSVPFGEADPEPLRVLEATGARLVPNPHGRKLTRDELLELLAREAPTAVVASTEPYDDAILEAAPSLKLIARTGIGLDSIDLEAAQSRGVAVTSTPDGPSDSVAELTVGLLVALARQVGPADRALRAGRWDRRTGWLLKERTVGIYGFGRCGSRVARLLRPFGCRILTTDIDPLALSYADELGAEPSPPDALVAACDLLTLHVPLTPRTRGLVDAGFLARMRPGALLVNTSRGDVVDEPALLAALERGHLGGAALDVFAVEPYRGPLAAREDVLLTAHMGSCSDAGRRAMELGAAKAVAAFLRRS